MITLNLGKTGQRNFSSFQEFVEWREKEREFWERNIQEFKPNAREFAHLTQQI